MKTDKKIGVPENVQGNFLKGTLEMMILILLSQKAMTPSQIRARIECDDTFFLSNINALYGVFNRLVEKGMISHKKSRITGNMYYIEPAGEEHLELMRYEYQKLNRKIQSIEEGK